MTMYQDLICGSEDEARTNLARLFPKAAKGGDLSGFPPNREAALARLDAMDTFRYAATRNALDGAVTRLSPYLRHGLLTLAETRDHVLACAAAAGRAPSAVAKLVQELAWRDYWRRVYGELGDGVWEDREPYKTGFAATDYADALPEDIPQGETGVDFVDHSARVLRDTGYLHNQLRMKIAAYVVHWRRVRWQAGARWFLEHLLDGDPASNNLSWQWVASTFSHKPYIFNASNLRKVSGGRFEGRDLRTGENPFEGSYEALSARLFPHLEDAA